MFLLHNITLKFENFTVKTVVLFAVLFRAHQLKCLFHFNKSRNQDPFCFFVKYE